MPSVVTSKETDGLPSQCPGSGLDETEVTVGVGVTMVGVAVGVNVGAGVRVVVGVGVGDGRTGTIHCALHVIGSTR